MKMTLNMGESELRALFVLLRAAYMQYPLQELRAQPTDYLILSCLDGFYGKLENKVRDAQMFGLGAGQKARMTLKRFEAIALLHVLEGERETDGEGFVPALAEASYEAAVIDSLTRDINKTFFS